MKPHVIEEVSYQRDYLRCSCGKVMTAVSGVGWTDHRRETGMMAAQNRAKKRWQERQVVG